jgi:transglutaminase-like putative cysteine protease
MEKKRPQLNLDELHQLKWLLGGGLTLLAVWTVIYMEIDAWELMGVVSVAAIACTLWPTLPARLPPVAHALAFPLIVAFFAGDLWLTASPLPAMVRLDMLLLLYRSISYRQRRDDLQIIILGLFLIVVAGVLTVSLVFAAQLLIFTGWALAFLLTITLVGTAEGPGVESGKVKNVAPAWAVHAEWRRLARRLREVADWRVLLLGGALFAGVVAVSALLFLAIPRFQLENSLFLERLVTKKAKSGFNDSIKFGDVTDIQQDTSVALSVDVTDRTQVPVSPYWRMLVLDQYENGTFRLSPVLRRVAFAGERTDTVVHGDARPRLGASVAWTFYLESGLSRYLPLLGSFELLRFRETQNFRHGVSLGVLALRDEPLTMTAYRVEGFELADARPDPTFPADSRRRERAIQTWLNVSTDDHARLDRLVGEITGGAKLSAADFSRRAIGWLRQNHGYSLSPVVPRGAGDPLVRWTASREAGHCELFAGALVLLARDAGFASRVVIGFRGGTWNGYSNSFTVRNSDAHAWTEIYDPAAGAWLREDALEVVTSAQEAETKSEAAIAARSDRSWAARLDSLRVFWYRRIVSFDQRSQIETLREVKTAAQSSSRRLRDAVAETIAGVREWLARPWSLARTSKVAALLALLGSVMWGTLRHHREIFRMFARGPVARRDDPVRADASRWLARLHAANRAPEKAVTLAVVGELQRLRFGARATWPEPEKTFRRAREAWRAERTARRRVSRP